MTEREEKIIELSATLAELTLTALQALPPDVRAGLAPRLFDELRQWRELLIQLVDPPVH
jgi:hypothetical protein